MFLPLREEVQQKAIKILAEFPKLVGVGAGRSGGDPFVIAEAWVSNCTLVTEERGGTVNKPKIPNVCRHYGIPTCTILDLILKEEWTF